MLELDVSFVANLLEDLSGITCSCIENDSILNLSLQLLIWLYIYLRLNCLTVDFFYLFTVFFFNAVLVLTNCSLSHLDTEDASETDLAKHEEEDYVEMKEQ